ncbi:uncharacterized protein LOC108088667 [Drosophila ficusphila]|uniref:uncharacterized protein LOC108088667 n=1 Tax=Drosophila ficusphila TaxID=30025 RepID=UPI0007E7C7FB|nr:uncharacterized protein LOC108088667 [Drosophila ficusphila]
MTSTLVLLIVSVLHFGMRGSCLLDIERFPVVPGTIYAGHVAYCAILHFLQDVEVLPQRYRRRMGKLAAFLVELVLGMAVMEVMALWLWCSVEHIVHLTLQFVLRRYFGMSSQFYLQWEWAIVGGTMSFLAGLLWLNAYAATEPIGLDEGKTGSEKCSRIKSKQAKHPVEDQEEKAPNVKQNQEEVDQIVEQSFPAEQKVQVLTTTTDC